MTPEVAKAIAELRATFPNNVTHVEEDGEGGAFVVFDNLFIGDQYEPSVSWIGFRVTFQYPHADVYPHYIDGNVKRRDEADFGDSFSKTEWRGRQAIQVSRKANHLNAAVDTATIKLHKILEWVRSR